MPEYNRKTALKLMLAGAIGFGASITVIAFYMIVMTLTADWYYAAMQFKEYRWWIVALALGLGIQTGLFVLLRRELREREKKSVRTTLAASGGMSATSMIVCCLHHLADVVPVVGLPVLAGILQQYQTYFFMAGVLSNLYGIFVLVRMLLRQGLIITGGIISPARLGSCHNG